jgi:hypothetical protein
LARRFKPLGSMISALGGYPMVNVHPAMIFMVRMDKV